MATYKEIHGVQVQYRDSDAPATVGDVWFNASAGKLKMYAALGSWATGNDMNDEHDEAGSFGIQTAAMQFGGRTTPTTGINDAETYDGTSWTESPNLSNTTYQNGGLGTTTAGVSFGGTPNHAETAEYDGSSWTEVNDMNSGRGLVRGDGVLTAGIAVAGSAGDAKGEDCELYDGTNWTEVNDLNTPRTGAAVFGTTTAAYAASGDNAGAATNFNNEEWNGT